MGVGCQIHNFWTHNWPAMGTSFDFTTTIFDKLKNFENILPALMITASHWAVKKLFAFISPLKIDGFYLQFTILVLLVVSHILLALFINGLF